MRPRSNFIVIAFSSLTFNRLSNLMLAGLGFCGSLSLWFSKCLCNSYYSLCPFSNNLKVFPLASLVAGLDWTFFDELFYTLYTVSSRDLTTVAPRDKAKCAAYEKTRLKDKAETRRKHAVVDTLSIGATVLICIVMIFIFNTCRLCFEFNTKMCNFIFTSVFDDSCRNFRKCCFHWPT